MFEIKVSGKTFEEFKTNLKIVCMNILREEENDVPLSQGPIKTETVVESPVTFAKEESNERQKSKRQRRKEEVISSVPAVDQASLDIKSTSTSEAEVSIEPIDSLKVKKVTPVKIEVTKNPTKIEYYKPDEVKTLWSKVYKEKGKARALEVLALNNVKKVQELSEEGYQKVAVMCVDILAENYDIPR